MHERNVSCWGNLILMELTKTHTENILFSSLMVFFVFKHILYNHNIFWEGPYHLMKSVQVAKIKGNCG